MSFLSSNEIFQDFVYTKSVTDYLPSTSTVLSKIKSLNQGVLTQNVNYKVI
jgi:hypothetical protein